MHFHIDKLDPATFRSARCPDVVVFAGDFLDVLLTNIVLLKFVLLGVEVLYRGIVLFSFYVVT